MNLRIKWLPSCWIGSDTVRGFLWVNIQYFVIPWQVIFLYFGYINTHSNQCGCIAHSSDLLTIAEHCVDTCCPWCSVIELLACRVRVWGLSSGYYFKDWVSPASEFQVTIILNWISWEINRFENNRDWSISSLLSLSHYVVKGVCDNLYDNSLPDPVAIWIEADRIFAMLQTLL